MKIIAKPQCTGKTKELIDYSLTHNIPIFCLTESKRRSLYEKSIAYFHKSVEVICAEELLNANCEQILVDDAESFIQFVIDDYSSNRIKLAGFSITTEN